MGIHRILQTMFICVPGKLSIKSPNMFLLLDECVEWLVNNNGNPQEDANCVINLRLVSIGTPQLAVNRQTNTMTFPWRRKQCLVSGSCLLQILT